MKGVARKTGFRLSAGMYTSMGMRLPGQASIALLLMGTGSRESGLMTRAGRNVLAEGRTEERRASGSPEGAEEKRASASPEKSEKTEECTTNTDKVDREIRELRKKKKELEQKLARSDDPEEKKRLETQLQQTERELQMKDNDSYRRSHAQYS